MLTFLENKNIKIKKRQRNLLFVLGLLIGLLIFLLINQGYFEKLFFVKKENLIKKFEKIVIDFSVLDNPIFENLRSFKVNPFEIKEPKKNPFLRSF